MSRRSDSHREEAKLTALRIISADPAITQRALADELGISLGATHYMLRALAERGLLKLQRFSDAEHKRGYAYVLTPKGLAEKASITARFLIRKRAEYEALRLEINELTSELGRRNVSHDHQSPDDAAQF
ncbi:MAG: MarR family EPS-associated transcriptional regulator [Erythrobacter sp.]|nr:MarR family EPS-associated transcriptional regulator [Erythrobacter sp.]